MKLLAMASSLDNRSKAPLLVEDRPKSTSLPAPLQKAVGGAALSAPLPSAHVLTWAYAIAVLWKKEEPRKDELKGSFLRKGHFFLSPWTVVKTIQSRSPFCWAFPELTELSVGVEGGEGRAGRMFEERRQVVSSQTRANPRVLFSFTGEK